MWYNLNYTMPYAASSIKLERESVETGWFEKLYSNMKRDQHSLTMKPFELQKGKKRENYWDNNCVQVIDLHAFWKIVIQAEHQNENKVYQFSSSSVA